MINTKNLTKFFNRPLTPHLTIYTGQITSLYSIWHRISSVLIILLIILLLFLLKFFSLCLINYQFTNLMTYLIPQNLFLINIILIFGYHALNGLRHISWDLGFNLHIHKLIITAWICIISLIFLFFFFVFKIYY